ncbi:MAG: ATP-binding cassette domain-containing protein [Treponema sp.]
MDLNRKKIADEVLLLRHVSLSENGNEFLTDLSLSLCEGEILDLISIDGHGSESLIKLIMKNRLLDSGEFFFCGEQVADCCSFKKQMNKVAIVGSKSNLIPALTAGENLFVTGIQKTLFANQKQIRQMVKKVFSPYGFDFNADDYPENLSAFERCCFEIIKAKSDGCKVIILREPSSFLSPSELKRLHLLIKEIARSDKIAFIYLCNHHEEILKVCTSVAFLFSGTCLLKKQTDIITEEMMETISVDALNSVIKLKNEQPFVQTKNQVAKIESSFISIDIHSSECLVILDLENKFVQALKDALYEPEKSDYSVTIAGKSAFKNPLLWSFVPENPCQHSLFYEMSYIDNLVIKSASLKMPGFWRRKKFRNTVIKEYEALCGSAIKKSNLYSLSCNQLYNLIYRRVQFENPKVVFIVQPFSALDMYQRIKVLEYISSLQKQGIAVVILAVSISDSLKLASRLVLIQHQKIIAELKPEDFAKASDFGIIVK